MRHPTTGDHLGNGATPAPNTTDKGVQVPIDAVHHRPFTLEPVAGKNILHTLTEGMDALSGVHAWLSAGTLLGLVRDGGFIPGDTDIDVAVLGPWEPVMPSEFTLIRTTTDPDTGARFQTAYMHDPTGVIFDVFAHYPFDPDRYYHRRENNEVIYTERALVDHLDTFYFAGRDYPVPNNLDRYLTCWYGDWRTPVPGGKRVWDTWAGFPA